LVILAGASLLALAVLAVRGFPLLERWAVSAVVPGDAPPLNRGDEVRVAGARFGEVRAVEPVASGAVVRMELDEGPVGAGARARVRVRGLSSVAYVELDRGDLRRPRPEGTTVPRSRTSAAPELVDVLDVFDAPTRGSLRRVVPTLGGGVLGRGADLNRTVADAGPGLAGSTRLVRALSPRRGAVAGSLANARRVLRALAPPGSRELEVLLVASADVLETVAARSAEVEQAVRVLPELETESASTLPPARFLLRDARAALVELRPGMYGLRDALPEVNALLGQERGLRSAARLARAAEPVLAESRPLLVELRPSIAALVPLLAATRPLVGELSRYDDELRLSSEGLRAVTARRSPQGAAAGRRALRTVPIFTCHRPRDPYPEPGEARRQRRECRD
jgi:phospholipid/cholesterol/gamma-HCH transport system substrate-binding protein